VSPRPTAALYVWSHSTLFVSSLFFASQRHRRAFFTQHLQFYIMLIRIPLTELHVLWLLILAHQVPKSKYKKEYRQIHYRLLQVT
jgi:hypothetical protein